MFAISILMHCMIAASSCCGMKQLLIDQCDRVNNTVVMMLDKARIVSLNQCNSVLAISLRNAFNGRSNEFSAYFIRDYSQGNIVYLTPLLEQEGKELQLFPHSYDEPTYPNSLREVKQGEELTTIALDYGVLLSAQEGWISLLRDVLRSRANIETRDTRLHTLKFIIKTRQGNPCTNDDIEHGKFSYLELSGRPVIAVNPYSMTYNFDAQRLAAIGCNLRILEEIKKNNPTQKLIVDIDKLCTQFDVEQQALQNAQQNNTIPVFQIMPPCDADDLSSNDSGSVQIKISIDKDHCVITAKTPIGTWKSPYLDIDTLAKLYAIIICINDPNGKQLINANNDWKMYPIFANCVVRNVTRIIERESYYNQHLLPENLVIFAQKTMPNISNVPQVTKLSSLLLCLCSAKSYDNSGKTLSSEWNMWHDTYLKSLLQTAYGKEFLTKLCNDNKGSFFVPTTKSYMQKDLWHNACVKMFTKTNPPLPEPIAQQIASFWQPDEQFKSGFKRLSIKQD